VHEVGHRCERGEGFHKSTHGLTWGWFALLGRFSLLDWSHFGGFSGG
jgi:hypothetical protein